MSISKQFLFTHEDGTRMAADIFTKMFQDSSKWNEARKLICIISPAELKQLVDVSKENWKETSAKPALPSKVQVATQIADACCKDAPSLDGGGAQACPSTSP